LEILHPWMRTRGEAEAAAPKHQQKEAGKFATFAGSILAPRNPRPVLLKCTALLSSSQPKNPWFWAVPYNLMWGNAKQGRPSSTGRTPLLHLYRLSRVTLRGIRLLPCLRPSCQALLHQEEALLGLNLPQPADIQPHPPFALPRTTPGPLV